MKLLFALAGLLLVAAPVAAFDSGDIAPGATWSMKFAEANPYGYSYHCHPHPSMTGMVHVNADTDGETTQHIVSIRDAGDIDEWGYFTQHLMIEVGDTVVWENDGTLTHTVTQMDGDGHDHGAMDGDHDHGDHDHGTEGGEDAPLPVLVPLVALAFAALRRRA